MQLIDKDFVGKCLPFLLFFKLEIMLFENHHRGREIDLQTFSTLRKFVFFILGLEEIPANFDLVSFFYQFTMSFKQCVYGFFSALLCYSFAFTISLLCYSYVCILCFLMKFLFFLYYSLLSS